MQAAANAAAVEFKTVVARMVEMPDGSAALGVCSSPTLQRPDTRAEDHCKPHSASCAPSQMFWKVCFASESDDDGRSSSSPARRTGGSAIAAISPTYADDVSVTEHYSGTSSSTRQAEEHATAAVCLDHANSVTPMPLAVLQTSHSQHLTDMPGILRFNNTQIVRHPSSVHPKHSCQHGIHQESIRPPLRSALSPHQSEFQTFDSFSCLETGSDNCMAPCYATSTAENSGAAANRQPDIATASKVYEAGGDEVVIQVGRHRMLGKDMQEARTYDY
jgi:hypothetical protein